MTLKVMVAAAVLVAGAAFAQHGHHGGTAPYAGQQTRAIASLSDEDVAELQRGGGWGFAKPAELNGYPGPAHLLELREQLGLTDAQVEAIRAAFETMRARAIREGEALIEAERRLDAAFRDRAVARDSLEALIGAAERSRAALRGTHLAAHLEVTPLLSEAQRRRYATLRGYGDDRCGQVPPGHDPALWRRHNGC